MLDMPYVCKVDARQLTMTFLAKWIAFPLMHCCEFQVNSDKEEYCVGAQHKGLHVC